MDLNHEVAGLNRRPGESPIDYWRRIHVDDDFINLKKDYSLPCLHIPVAQFQNAKFSTSEEIYYFSITAGEKKQNFSAQEELFTEPKLTVKLSLGFDAEVVQHLK